MKRDAAAPAEPGVPAKGIKWEHYVDLKRDKTVKPHLPDTARLNEQSLIAMLSRYKTVYLKPNRGAFGEGVMQVRRMDGGGSRRYRIHTGVRQQTFDSERQLYAFIRANRLNADYLVQQGIELLRWNNRPFDLRMMISKQATAIGGTKALSDAPPIRKKS